ncbi:MAG: hypothetical protein GY925_23340 [Actinomycetia bacterium]|nr:hypothetical protein [Actinomycetes bacterium]
MQRMGAPGGTKSTFHELLRAARLGTMATALATAALLLSACAEGADPVEVAVADTWAHAVARGGGGAPSFCADDDGGERSRVMDSLLENQNLSVQEAEVAWERLLELCENG